MPTQILTVGHSTLSVDAFLNLLRANGVTAVADVRSAPYSRFNPVFNREGLKEKLREQGIEYVFLGKELGGRPEDPSCYEDGRADYSRMAQTDEFNEGIRRVSDGSHKYRIALMCSEGDPLNCHRTLLLARVLSARGFDIRHIERDGVSSSQQELENRLLREVGLSDNLLSSRNQLLAEAYALQSKREAYVNRKGGKAQTDAT
jgi:uncharacterized protein (DUF488 family)